MKVAARKKMEGVGQTPRQRNLKGQPPATVPFSLTAKTFLPIALTNSACERYRLPLLRQRLFLYTTSIAKNKPPLRQPEQDLLML